MSTPQQPGSTTTVVQQAVTENTDKRDIAGALKRQLQQSLAFGTLIVLVIFFSIASPAFFTVSNLTTVLLSTAVIAILALGTTFVIITGGIDLSLGTGMALSAVMTGVFITNWGMPIWVGVLGGIATGVLMGLVNGVNITILRLPPFIATLAMMMIAGGLALVISNVRPIYFSTSAPEFKRIALGTLIPGIPNAVLITLVLAVVAALVLSKTLLGRYTFAIGSNEEATRLSGVNTRRWTIFVYMFAGAFVGVAGVVIASRLDSAQPQIGMGYELQAIAAVIIGGTSLLGGRGSIVGTVIGALIMSVLVNGLRIMSIQTEWQNVVVGVVVLLAVFFDSLRNRQRT
ncbi:ABC transporter permease [Microbacterium esteraromaticum]|uniref:ABC transporter permease n=1 Tax=Microbacterium esteraromaticum TaxID=57043 RepID=UPI0019D344C6|nr:ABC transporter permease [Microbacterium esteraromaticum]MBN7794293.1 ABC transporter permease [Microbacterium esteraromaticum]MCA1306630.1 ABC transporter permease [Microbacterium esteraromaticum]WDH78583.1 ABC transporter permease [Microbacterium esteraromaticum]